MRRAVKKTAWRKEMASGWERQVCIFPATEFFPVLSLVINTGKEPGYGLSVLSQPVLCIFRPCWLLWRGAGPAESLHLWCLLSYFFCWRELRQYGGEQKQGTSPFLWLPGSKELTSLLPWILRLIRPQIFLS